MLRNCDNKGGIMNIFKGLNINEWLIIIGVLIGIGTTYYVNYVVPNPYVSVWETVPVKINIKEVKPSIVFMDYTTEEAESGRIIFQSEVGDNIPPSRQREVLALASTLYCEARGEPWLGVEYVADTIRNRVNSNMFPNTYYDVVTQHKQFSCVNNKVDLAGNVEIHNDEEANKYREIIMLANRVIDNRLPRMTYNALFYHTKKVNPLWSNAYESLGSVGHHMFYTTAKL